MAKTNSKIIVSNTEITIIQQNNEDYISLTDMAGYKDNLEARIVVSNWMSTHFTVDFLAVWEQVNNPYFNRMGFHTVRNGEDRLVLTHKRWGEMTKTVNLRMIVTIQKMEKALNKDILSIDIREDYLLKKGQLNINTSEYQQEKQR